MKVTKINFDEYYSIVNTEPKNTILELTEKSGFAGVQLAIRDIQFGEKKSNLNISWEVLCEPDRFDNVSEKEKAKFERLAKRILRVVIGSALKAAATEVDKKETARELESKIISPHTGRPLQTLNRQQRRAIEKAQKRAKR